MRAFVMSLHTQRMEHLAAHYTTLDIDCIKSLHELYRQTPTDAEDGLKALFTQYDESRTGVLSHYETKAFFDDFFHAYLHPSVSMHLRLIVRERFLHMRQLAEQRQVSPRADRTEDQLLEEAMKRSEEILGPGILEAEAIYHNQGYLVKTEWIRFCDFEGDGKLHVSEVHKTFLGDQSVVFERMFLSLLGLDSYLETARVVADKIMFGARKSVEIDIADSPRVPSEGVVLGFSHHDSPHHGVVSVVRDPHRVLTPTICTATSHHSGYTPTHEKLMIDRTLSPSCNQDTHIVPSSAEGFSLGEKK